jgi:hypothetical protein
VADTQSGWYAVLPGQSQPYLYAIGPYYALNALKQVPGVRYTYQIAAPM